MSSLRVIGTVAAVAMALACAPPSRQASMAVPFLTTTPVADQWQMDEPYQQVPAGAAEILGCSPGVLSPVCEIAPPNAEEDSAFTAEAERLAAHSERRCRELGAAIAVNKASVMMYRKALIRYSGLVRLYGVGHTYALDDMWLVRVARRLDDLNERTLEDKTRTLRHEMSHTIGASEAPGAGWTADDYAIRCG